MIKKKDIGLVLDTNILIDIVGSSNTLDDLVPCLTDWIKKIVLRAHPHPRGKTVTLFVDEQVLSDYSAGLSRSGNRGVGKQLLRQILKRNIGSRKLISSDYRIHFSLNIIGKSQTASASRRRVPDRSDEKFLVLLESVMKSQRWKNWAIIMASRDRTTFARIRDIKQHVAGISFVDSKEKLDQTIEC